MNIEDITADIARSLSEQYSKQFSEDHILVGDELVIAQMFTALQFLPGLRRRLHNYENGLAVNNPQLLENLRGRIYHWQSVLSNQHNRQILQSYLDTL